LAKTPTKILLNPSKIESLIPIGWWMAERVPEAKLIRTLSWYYYYYYYHHY
jgi:hypothetical protein